MLLISLSSILLSLMIAVIPFIAKRIISGDVGSTLFTALAVAGAALQTLAVGSAGLSSGYGSGDGGGGGGGGPDRNPPPDRQKGPGEDIGSTKAPRPPDDPGSSPPPPAGGGDASGSSGTAPNGPNDAMATTSRQGGGGVAVRERPQTAGGGGGGGHPPDRDPGGGGSRNSGFRQPYVSGLYSIPYAAFWAAGRTARAMRNTFSRSSEEG